jgi:hypothetical protein
VFSVSRLDCEKPNLKAEGIGNPAVVRFSGVLSGGELRIEGDCSSWAGAGRGHGELRVGVIPQPHPNGVMARTTDANVTLRDFSKRVRML